MENQKKDKVGLRMWLVILFVGLAGQFAWAIENMYLNTYITYLNFSDTQGSGFDYSTYIAITTALSAIMATLTTIFMGALTDKVGKRKLFVSLGYIIWGIATASFGLCDVTSSSAIIPISMSASMAAIFVIVIDCVMTFFGSTSNDAAFNSFITSNVSEKNKSKVEGVLSVLPLIAMLGIFVGLNGLTTNGHWDLFFYIVGGIVLVVGLLSLFLIPKDKSIEKKNENIFSLIIYGFKLSTIKKNKTLYLTLLIYFIYAVSCQVFFPYLMVYIERTCNILNSGDGILTPFAIVMAIALLGGSLGSVLLGFAADKKGKSSMILPSLIIFFIGVFSMFFIPYFDNDGFRTVYCAISALVMIFGYVGVPTIINALVRQYIPEGKEGAFMGVRMIFVVALPMIIGPFIGNALNASYGVSYIDPTYGTEGTVPSNYGYLAACAILLLVLIPSFILIKRVKKDEKASLTNHAKLYEVKDRYGVDEIPLSEYPRMDLQRDSYLCLNGKWNFCMKKEDSLPEEYSETILVPYAVESKLSGIERVVNPDDYLFYEREVVLPKGFNKGKLILHFEAVDQIADVYINKKLVRHHEGGYTKFEIILPKDIEDTFLLTVKVKDVTDTSYYERGKQKLNGEAWWYSSSSGIYMPVWMESVPEHYIEKIFFTPDYDNKCVAIKALTHSDLPIHVKIGGLETDIAPNKESMISLSSIFHPWSTEDPYLYNVTMTVEEDSVKSYFGMRKIEIKKDETTGYKNLYLNDKKIFMTGLLDQGYYYLGNLTPKTYKDYTDDIENCLKLGYNVLRKHIKIELDRFYYDCDRLGMLLIQDFPCGGRSYDFWAVVRPRMFDFINDYKHVHSYKYLGRQDKEGRDDFDREQDEWIENLYNHPSIVIYTIFNEGWGEFDPDEHYLHLKKKDPTRLYDSTSGWYWNKESDIFSVHAYDFTHKERKSKYGHPFMLSEIGGTALRVDGHYFFGKKVYGHHNSRTAADLEEKYRKRYVNDIIPLKEKGCLIGAIYTQLSDVETEANGIYTFDRKVLKIKSKTLKDINEKLTK